MVDPAFHSCGTVPPHGHRELAHPDEPGFYVVGMKSYGRAPTFLITTGNEQVRSIAAHLAGDAAAADEVLLGLPETGVCSVNLPLTDDPAPVGGACCGAPATEPSTSETGDAEVDAAHAARADGQPRVGFATGVGGGRAADADRGLLPLAEAAAPGTGGSCCG